MKNDRPFSQSDMVLLATYRASKSFGSRVPFEEIVLQAWVDFPEKFGLNNHTEHPDSYPIHRRLSGDLLADGFVLSLGKQVYRLTEKGLEIAKELDTQSYSKKKSKSNNKTALNVIRLNREQEDFLQQATRSRAFMTWKQGKKKDLIDYDARMFFQFSTGTPIRERKRKVENARSAIKKAVALNRTDATALNDLIQFLTENFSQLLEEG